MAAVLAGAAEQVVGEDLALGRRALGTTASGLKT